MGLLLSVLVFSVGVVEALSCYNRFRSGYLPLNYHKGRQHSQTIGDIIPGLESSLHQPSRNHPNQITDEDDDSKTLSFTQSDVLCCTESEPKSYPVENVNHTNEDNEYDDDNESNTSENTILLSDGDEPDKSKDLASMECNVSNNTDYYFTKSESEIENRKGNITLFQNTGDKEELSLSQDSWSDENILSSLDPNVLVSKKITADKSVCDRSVYNAKKNLEESINFAENVHIQRNHSKLHRSISEPLCEERIITGRLQLYSNSMSMDEGLNERSILAKEGKRTPKKKVRFNLDTVQICFEKDSVSDDHNSSTTDIIVKSSLPLTLPQKKDKGTSETLAATVEDSIVDLNSGKSDRTDNSETIFDSKKNSTVVTDISLEAQGVEHGKFHVLPYDDKTNDDSTPYPCNDLSMLADQKSPLKKIVTIEENDDVKQQSSLVDKEVERSNIASSENCSISLNRYPTVKDSEILHTNPAQVGLTEKRAADDIIANIRNENNQEIDINNLLFILTSDVKTNDNTKYDNRQSKNNHFIEGEDSKEFFFNSLQNTNNDSGEGLNITCRNETNQQDTLSNRNGIREAIYLEKQEQNCDFHTENVIDVEPSMENKTLDNKNTNLLLTGSTATEIETTKEGKPSIVEEVSASKSGNDASTSITFSNGSNTKLSFDKKELIEEIGVNDTVSISKETDKAPLDFLGKDISIEDQYLQIAIPGNREIENFQDSMVQSPKQKKSPESKSVLPNSDVKQIEDDSQKGSKNDKNEGKKISRRGAVKSKFKYDRSAVKEDRQIKTSPRGSGNSRNKEFQEASGTESEEDWHVEEVSDGVETESDSEAALAEPSTSQERNRKNLPDDKSTSQKAFWLIFSGEYTKAMSKDWHSSHFCCWQCDESLTGQRYVLRDDHPYCIKCYESVFANSCEECSRVIGIDSKDLSYKDKHWHEACFLCSKCRVSLVDKQFGSKADKIYCGNCYDAQFASRCDGCGQIFRAGTKKMEYKTRQWHEQCFCCCVCKTPIGTKSFIPREQEIYCATCYEEKFATRCVKCNKIITSGGVTYKNEPWHRECFTCTNCGTSLAGQRFTSREDKPYCADCFGELFAKRCTACCKPITGIGGTRFISFEDRHWHNDCFICASCKTSLVGRGFITDGEDIICPECAKQKLM